MVVPGLLVVTGWFSHTDTEVMESLQDVGMTAEQSSHQDGQQRNDDTEYDGQSNHE